MDLVQLHFTYEIPEKRFDYMSYEFQAVKSNSDVKETVEVAKSALQELELIIISNYNNKIKKEEIGSIDSYKIKYGYKYTEKSKIFSLSSFTNSTQLTYSIGLSSEGMPTKLEINLMNHNKKNMLKLYDNILDIPDLMVTENVRKQIEHIEYLRHNKFDATKYLLLK